MIIDETGAVADGDQIMALFATRWAEAGRLATDTLVATVMSNLGLERLPGKRAACSSSARRSATATWSSGCARAAGTSAASSRATS